MKPIIRNIVIIIILIASAIQQLSAQYAVISNIELHGNEKTQPNIILRELSFAVGDSIAIDKLNEATRISENRLRLLGLFNFIDIDYYLQDSIYAMVSVNVVERWYFWIYPILEVGDINLDTYFLNREYNRLNYGLSFEKHNLFGKNQLIKAKIRLGFKEQYSMYYAKASASGNKNIGYFIGTDYFRMKEAVIDAVDFAPVYYSSPNENRYIYHYLNASAGSSLKINPTTKLKAKLAYHYYLCDIDYADFGNTNFKFAEVSVKIESDIRDNKYFPSSGYYISFETSKYGLIKHPGFNSADQLIFDLKFDAHTHIGKRWLLGTQTNWVYQISHDEHTNFWLYRSIGYDNYLRGCDNLIINSMAYAYTKNSVRFALFQKDRSLLHFTGLDQFDIFHVSLYASAFADIAIASPYGLISGVGAGFDLVTYYDRVLSLYYAYNNLTEKFNIFVQFKSPIIKQY